MWTSSLNKSGLLLPVLALLVASPVLGQDKNAAAGTPRARFTETRHEAGTVNEGTIVVHEFEVANEGERVLRISELVPA